MLGKENSFKKTSSTFRTDDGDVTEPSKICLLISLLVLDQNLLQI